ncbi:MAG: OprO/OprP family phosphate-selective porin, partial [Ignavibacteria bacterium]|nr:OprO/OprP family phosphate-selective porin [Ignavibacteria bacterium]
MKLKIVFSILFVILINEVFAQEGKLSQVYGFFQPVYRVNLDNSTNPNNEFYINRFRLGLETKIYKSLKSEIELDPFDPILIKDADFRWRFLNRFELTLGKFKKPFSLERLTSVREIPFLERTKIVKELDKLGYAGRDLGLQLLYNLTFNNLDIKLIGGVFNGNPNSVEGDDNNQKTFV